MNPNPLLVVAGVFYGLSGIALSFASGEIFAAAGAPPSPFTTWLGQIIGAALLGFGWLTWMLRHTKMGGVLGRPLLITNLVFASVTFWTSLSAWRHDPTNRAAIVAAVPFGILSVAFGSRLFVRPEGPVTVR